MIKINLSDQSTSNYVDQTLKISWKGHWIHRIKEMLHPIYLFILKMHSSEAVELKNRHNSNVGLETQQNEQPAGMNRDLLPQIKGAEKFYREKQEALEYVRHFKAKQTLSLFVKDLSSIQSLLSQYSMEMSSEEQGSCREEIGILINSLIQEQSGLESASLFVLDDHLEALKQKIQSFHPHLTRYINQLPKKSLQRIEMNKLAQIYVKDVQTQFLIYMTPSSDPYLHALQTNEKIARNALEELNLAAMRS